MVLPFIYYKISNMRQVIKGTCVDLSSEGKGVVKNGNNVIFVDGLFPNEEADIEVLYHRAGVNFGKVLKLYKLSEDRTRLLSYAAFYIRK